MGVKERKAREFQRREREILDAAYDLLTRLEPIQMTMEMVAEKAEIGRGTTYKHFKSKDEIFARLVLRRQNQYLDQLKLIAKETGDLLRKLIRSYEAYCMDDQVAYAVHQKCMHHYVESNLNEDLVEAMRAQQETKVALVEGIMQKALGEQSSNPPNTKYLIYAGWGMMRGAMDFVIENRVMGEAFDENLFSNAVEQILMSGIPVS